MPKVTGADVDIRRATDNAIRLVKESFRGKKELLVSPSAFAMVPKNEKKAVPFGAAYMESLHFEGDWFAAKKDTIQAVSWIVADGETKMIDMEYTQGLAFAFKSGVQGGKGVNYVLQAIQYGVNKKVYESPSVCFIGDTWGFGPANRGVDLGAALLIVGLSRAEMHASLSAFAKSEERKQGGSHAGMTEYVAAGADLGITMLPTMAPHETDGVYDADEVGVEHYVLVASDIDSSAFGKGGEGLLELLAIFNHDGVTRVKSAKKLKLENGEHIVKIVLRTSLQYDARVGRMLDTLVKQGTILTVEGEEFEVKVYKNERRARSSRAWVLGRAGRVRLAVILTEPRGRRWKRLRRRALWRWRPSLRCRWRRRRRSRPR